LTAAISGAHTVGSARPDVSGYDGFWSDQENQGIFNNDYYKSILRHGWGPELSVGGNPKKNQWKLVDLHKDNEHKEIMLTTDMCLAYVNHRKWLGCKKDAVSNDVLTLYQNRWECAMNLYESAKDLDPLDSNCCAWTKLTWL